MAVEHDNSAEIDKAIKKKINRGIRESVLLGIAGFWVVASLFVFLSIWIEGDVDWGLLEGFASLISLGVIIGGTTFALAEYNDKEKIRLKEQDVEKREKNKISYEIYQAIFAKITDPDQEAARRWILNNLNEKSSGEALADWYDRENKKVIPDPESGERTEGQKAIKLTLNAFDYIGFIADHYWDADDDTLDWISAPIAKVWERLGPYVERVQELRKVDDYYLSAQSIGKRCVEWRESRGLAKEDMVKSTP